MKTYKVFQGDNLDLLSQYPDNYFDSVVTDCPYGLGKEPDATEMLKAWVENGYMEVKGSGFMGKQWDAFVPQPIFWKEVFRVLKHGGHVLSFFGTRTYDWGVMAMRLAGFEVRDCIQWLYGSGFPKALDVSKAIDKMYGAEREVVGVNGTRPIQTSGRINTEASANNSFDREENIITKAFSEQAKKWEGWKSALKPANEPIVLARKPLEKGLSIAENVLKWGTGAINIDGCRISTSETWTNVAQDIRGLNGLMAKKGNHPTLIKESNPQGRFPANLILTHHPECECKGLKKVKGDGNFPSNQNTKSIKMSSLGKTLTPEIDYGDENGEETIEDWACHDDCPIKLLDEQSGESKSNNTKRNRNTIGSFGMPNDNTPEYSDKGGASRFFHNTSFQESDYGDENGEETIEDWACHDDCPIKLLDEQSGESRSTDAIRKNNRPMANAFGKYNPDETKGYSDKGGASRFFYVAKASKSERNKGLDGFEEKQSVGGGGITSPKDIHGNIIVSGDKGTAGKYGSAKAISSNFHPTVKPIKLMQYLVRLITPPNGIVLDPFCGSGTTGIACKLEGFNFIGMEQDVEYSKIAEARIENYVEEKEITPKIINSENNDKIENQLKLF